MKCRLDGLAPAEFVVSYQESAGSLSEERPSQDAVSTQRRFLTLFGGGKNGRSHDLPRRQKRLRTLDDVSVVDGKENLASLKRKRCAQLQAFEPEEKPDAQQLAEQARDAAMVVKARPEFKQLAERLSTLAEAKRRQFIEDANLASGTIAAKYQEALQKERKLKAELHELAQKGHVLDPSQQAALDAAGVALVIQEQDRQADFTGLRTEVLVWDGTEDQIACLMSKQQIIWFAGSVSREMAMMMPGSHDISGFVTGSRLLGGFVASETWLLACQKSGSLLQPHLRLCGAVFSKRYIEMYIHKSAGEQGTDMARLVVRVAQAALSHGHNATFVLQPQWRNVKRKGALVLATAEGLKKARKHQRKERRLGHVLDPVAFLHACTEWMS